MRIRCLRRYNDSVLDIRMNEGEIMDVDESRGNELIQKGFVEKAECGDRKISIFLSYPRPHLKSQRCFSNNLRKKILNTTDFEPKTLGVTDFDLDAPLIAIRDIMSKCSGLLVIALKQTFISDGEFRANSDIGISSKKIENKWITSPYCHIEPAMALQMDMPIFILREKEIIQDGIFDNGSLGLYMSDIDLSLPTEKYFETLEWIQLFDKWKARVSAYHENKQFSES